MVRWYAATPPYHVFWFCKYGPFRSWSKTIFSYWTEGMALFLRLCSWWVGGGVNRPCFWFGWSRCWCSSSLDPSSKTHGGGNTGNMGIMGSTGDAACVIDKEATEGGVQFIIAVAPGKEPIVGEAYAICACGGIAGICRTGLIAPKERFPSKTNELRLWLLSLCFMPEGWGLFFFSSFFLIESPR